MITKQTNFSTLLEVHNGCKMLIISTIFMAIDSDGYSVGHKNTKDIRENMEKWPCDSSGRSKHWPLKAISTVVKACYETHLKKIESWTEIGRELACLQINSIPTSWQ